MILLTCLIKCLLILSDDSSSVFCHVRLLLPVPEVEECEEEQQEEGVRGHGAVVEEGVQLAERLARPPPHHVHGLEIYEMKEWILLHGLAKNLPSEKVTAVQNGFYSCIYNKNNINCLGRTFQTSVVSISDCRRFSTT